VISYQLSVISYQLSVISYTQEGNKLDFLRNKNHFEKPQRGDINTAWGSAPGNPNYDHVEYINCPNFSRSPNFGVQTLVWQFISDKLSVISDQLSKLWSLNFSLAGVQT
jgi:hypothetical protein